MGGDLPLTRESAADKAVGSIPPALSLHVEPERSSVPVQERRDTDGVCPQHKRLGHHGRIVEKKRDGGDAEAARTRHQLSCRRPDASLDGEAVRVGRGGATQDARATHLSDPERIDAAGVLNADGHCAHRRRHEQGVRHESDESRRVLCRDLRAEPAHLR